MVAIASTPETAADYAANRLGIAKDVNDGATDVLIRWARIRTYIAANGLYQAGINPEKSSLTWRQFCDRWNPAGDR